MIATKYGSWILIIAITLVIFAIRLFGITTFPAFIDETVHIHTQERIWETSPFVELGIGRIGTIWWLFLFQPQQSAPMFVARTALLIASLLGMVALLKLIQQRAGSLAVLLMGLFCIGNTYLFFFNRLALADTLTASLIGVAVFLGWRITQSAQPRDALLCGIVIFMAIFAKTNAIPYMGIPLAAILFTPVPRDKRLRLLFMSYGAIIIPMLIFEAFAIWRGYGWITGTINYIQSRAVEDTPLLMRIIDHATNMMDVLIGYMGAQLFLICVLMVLIALVWRQWYLLLVFFAPLLPLWMGNPQETRYWIVPVHLFLTIGAIIIADLFRNRSRRMVAIVTCLISLLVFIQAFPFFSVVWSNPVQLPLPATDQRQYIYSDAIGFGFEQIPDHVPDDAIIIGILGNCQGLRYTYWNRYDVRCIVINPNGEDRQEILEWVESLRSQQPYVILEANDYVPTTLDAPIIAVIERVGGQAPLTIYSFNE